MLDEPSTIVSEELTADDSSTEFNVDSAPEQPHSPLKKIILIGALVASLLLLGLIIFVVVNKYWLNPAPAEVATSTPISSSTTTPVLPGLDQASTSTDSIATSTAADLAVEYMSFADFYEAPDNKFEAKINDYELPLNVKIDVVNYYDVSRKVNLDSGLENLDNNGFTLLDNPWNQTTPGFYGAYTSLADKQLPILITSDFIVYSYQNSLKQAFKDIETNVFYDNLWDINESLYTTAKNRYETRLASIGGINDSILEGERLEAAFFAVALELLKPTAAQISTSISNSDSGKTLSKTEASRFSFVVPPYLRDDVLSEVKLIREAKINNIKSPALLYNRDYTEFSVPTDYLGSAKLNNFYLTAKWLNSVFPLNYRDKDCPNCLLDSADWRVNMTAASFMAKDFATLPELKNKWARIYKLMSFFKGLRENLNYVFYRDTLVELFGEDYQIEALFTDSNKETAANLEKLRQKLLSYTFSEISSGFSNDDINGKTKLGFKILAEEYWPNNYIFTNLTNPAVGVYMATTTTANNFTACVHPVTKAINRCYGLALDPVNLVYPIVGHDYFVENTNYANYSQQVQSLRTGLNKSDIWHLNNYWTSLNFIKAGLEMDKNNLPLFAHSAAWQNMSFNSAAAAWINLQLPRDNLLRPKKDSNFALASGAMLDKNFYVEPNLNLINELLADNNMLLGMFSALQLDSEVPFAWQNLKDLSADLSSLRTMMNKELSSEDLDLSDGVVINRLINTWSLGTPASSKQLLLKTATAPKGWREDLSNLKLLILVHQSGTSPAFAIGPVWDYKETY